MKQKPLKINTEEILNALSAVRPGLASKEFVETTTHYLFSDDKIITFNGKICISYPCNYFNDVFTIKAKDFYNVIKTIKDDQFSCKITNSRLMLKSKDTEAGIKINKDDMQVKEMYDELGIDDLEFQKLNDAEEFKKGLNLCRFSTSKDATYGFFYCLSVNKDHICSSDNYRASYFEIDEDIEPFLIPATSVNELVNYDFNEICIDNNWVHFRNEDGLIFSSGLIDGEYPDFKDMLLNSKKETEVSLPKELKDILDQVAVMSKGETDVEKKVAILIENGILTCKSEKDIGYLKKKIKTKYKGDTVSFSINPIFLQQILTKTNKFFLTDKGALFSTDNFTHLLAILTDQGKE